MNNFIKIEYLFWKLKLTLERFILIVHKEDAIFAMNFGKMQCALWTDMEDAMCNILWTLWRCNVCCDFQEDAMFT